MWRSCSLTEMISAGTKLFETLGPGRLFALRPIGFLRTIGQVKRPLWTPKNSEQPNTSSVLGPIPYTSCPGSGRSQKSLSSFQSEPRLPEFAV